MTHEDEVQFFQAAQQAGTSFLMLNAFSSHETMYVTEFQPSKGLADSNYSIVRAEDKASVKHEYFPAIQRHSVSVAENNLVQFNRSYVSDNRLVSGRLWYETVTVSGKKPDEFLAWAEKLTKWIKKNYKRDEQGFYVGPDALLQAGQGKFILGYPQ